MAKAIKNKKAFFEYDLNDRIEAGIVLVGSEIKAIRAGKVSLVGSYGRILYKDDKPELWLVGAHISSETEDPTRTRKLLVHSHEIQKLIGITQQKGLTLVPTKIYFKKGRAKVELSVGRGRKTHDKREAIKRRDLERDLHQR